MQKDNKNVCLACGKQLPEKKLISLENMPSSAQDIPEKNQIDSDRPMKLNLYQCENCGLVQFDCSPVSYYKDVIRSGGFSTTMVNLRKKQYAYLIDTYSLQGKNFLEIGCGQGEFLSVLKEFDVNAYGIEHRSSLVNTAKENGLCVWEDFALNKQTRLKDPYNVKKYDAFLSFNFLEHQPDPRGMLDCIYEHLVENGMGLITVPSLEYILEHDGYYELIRDHLAYYSFETLESLLNRAGFEVLEKEIVNRDTLSVIVRKSRNKVCKKSSVSVPQIDISGLNKSFHTINTEVETLINRMSYDHKKLALWGASHQGFTLAATTKIKNFASYIVDSAPFKQGKYAPASHLPIVSPDYLKKELVDTILIVAPDYTDEIADIIKNKLSLKAKILVLKSKHIENYSKEI